MVKQIFFAKKRPDLTFEQYKKYYLEKHVPLVKKAFPEIRRYVVNFALQRGKETPYDAVTEICWDDVETIIKTAKSGTFNEAIVADEKNFSARLGHVLLTEETIQKGGDVDGRNLVKQVIMLRRKPGMTFDQYKKHYLERHAPLVRETLPEIKKYIVNFALQRGKETLFDSVTTIYFDDVETVKSAFKSDRAKNIIEPDEFRFLDRPAAKVILTEETIHK